MAKQINKIKGTYYLYMHLRKTDLTPFYIGVGNFKRCSNFNLRNDIWKKEFKKFGCEVIVIECSENLQHLYKREIDLISHYGRLIYNTGILANISSGGAGTGGVKFTEERIEKLRERTTGLKHSKEAKKKMSDAKKGTTLSEEIRLKISKSHKERTFFHSGFGIEVLDLETGILYGNIRLACESLLLNPNSIQKKIKRGKYKRLTYGQTN